MPAVWLDRCPDADRAQAVLPPLLEGAELWGGRNLRGLRVLVKPNLLRAVPLACTTPEVTFAVCRWLLDCGAKVKIADSPGFGTAGGVAGAVGMTEALAGLGLRVEPMRGAVPVRLASGDEVCLSATALEADALLSVARVKAHSQMRITLSCKNLYGCVPGLRKAWHHTRQGCVPERFAAMQAALASALPPVAGVADGIVAMHVTGPASGRPYPLGLVGVSDSPVALDEAVCLALGRRPEDMPLQRAFIEAGHPDCLASGARHSYPRLCPGDFAARDFVLPQELMHTSFRPARLLRSCLRRLWAQLAH
ncbi:MAG: DUF362 domain-containing protein [Desulfovibrionaceae bacterium]|nr:DUF362 domain-containing protein [Desulfovibrionaceae bacterium]